MDAGFSVTHPSPMQIERFKVEEKKGEPQINIYDERDLQGIIADGEPEALKRLRGEINSTLKDAIFRIFPYSVGGVYKGKIQLEEAKGRAVKVDIGRSSGWLRKEELKSPIDGAIMVQVKKSSYSPGYPRLTTDIAIPHRFAVLISGGEVKVSRKILNPKERERLIEIGRKNLEGDWGVIWRSSAEGSPLEALVEYIRGLNDEARNLQSKMLMEDAPALIREGFDRAYVEFPYLSKRRLDDVRDEVTPTLLGHHLYKSSCSYLSAAVDMAERLLRSGKAREEVEESFRRAVTREFPSEGSNVGIEHVKIDGRVFNLGSAEIEFIDENYSLIRLKRTIKGRGIYDGIETARSPGDYSITETGFGKWTLKTIYCSKEGLFKGAYINVNTPVEIYPDHIRYVDLEVDVCVKPEGEIEVIDEDVLDEALSENLISHQLFSEAKKRLDLAVSLLRDALNEEENAYQAVLKAATN